MSEGQKPEVNANYGGSDAPTRSSTHQSPGTQLSNRRMELSLSVDQVASRLNFAPRQIIAIESDDYAALPGTAVTRGFIRAYAKLLQLDPAPLLQDIARHAPLDEPLPLRSAAATTSFGKHELNLGSKRRTFPVLVVLLILAVVIGVAFFLAQHFGGAPLFAKLPFLQDKASPTSFAVEEPVAPGQSQFMLEPLSLPDSSPQQYPEAALPAASSLETLPAAASSATAPELAAAPNTAAENNQLVLKLRQDSWLDIRGADNSLVFSGLGKAGETKTIDMQQALNLKVGNAVGVNATLRGKSFDLRAGQRGNVVRLTLE